MTTYTVPIPGLTDTITLVPTPAAPVAWGIYSTNRGAPWNQYLPSVNGKLFGRDPAIAHQFVPIVDTTKRGEDTDRSLFDHVFADDCAAVGAVPLFSHELRDHTVPMRVPQPQYTPQQWIAGANDAPLIRWLQGAAAWGERFLWRVGWEANGWDYTWAVNFPGNSCGLFIDWWHHVVSLQRQYAPLGEPVWCPSGLMPANARLTPMSWFYPGRDWVRWVGLDKYITGDVSASGPNCSFLDLFAPSVGEVARFAPDKPVLICETGCNPQDATLDSAAWLAGIADALKQMKRVRGVCFFDNQQSVIHNEPQRGAVAALLTNPYMQGKLQP